MSYIENRHIIAWLSNILSDPDVSDGYSVGAELLAVVNQQIELVKGLIQYNSDWMASMVEKTHKVYTSFDPEELEYDRSRWEKHRENKRTAERLIQDVYDLYKELSACLLCATACLIMCCYALVSKRFSDVCRVINLFQQPRRVTAKPS